MGIPLKNLNASYSPKLKAIADARATEHRILTDASHYWSQKSLPFARAVACTQIVLDYGKADALYREAKESWGRPDCLVAMNDFLTDLLDTNTWAARVHKVKQLYDLGYGGLPESECTGWDWIAEKHKDSADFEYLIDRMADFIRVGFNRQIDQDNEALKVLAIPTEGPPWLLVAVTTFSCAEFCKVKLDTWNKCGRMEVGGKTYDMEAIMRDKPTNRMHRRLVEAYQKCQHVLKHDKALLKEADQWYKCRVNPGTVPLYIEELVKQYAKDAKCADKGIEAANIYRQLAPYDEVTAYPRHWRD